MLLYRDFFALLPRAFAAIDLMLLLVLPLRRTRDALEATLFPVLIPFGLDIVFYDLF